MTYLIWLLSLLASFTLGYKLGDLTKQIKSLQQAVKEKVDKPVKEEPVSEIIDPYDPVQTALYEREKMMARLNPKE